MPLEPRSVLIPIVAGQEPVGRLLRIEASATPRETHDAKLNPCLAHLMQYRLYGAGEIALSAIRRLALARRTGAALPFLRSRPVAGHLEATNGADFKGLTPETSGSAELGLALALLMYAGPSPLRTVFATGALARDNDAAGTETRQVRVLPVAGLSAKIEAVRQSLDTKGVAIPRSALFFLPSRTQDGLETVAVHAAELERLKDAFAAQRIELAVCPVTSLEEAVGRLGITSLKPPPGAGIAAGLAAAVVLGGLLTVAARLWLWSPIELEFASMVIEGGASVQTPFRARFNGQGQIEMQKACLDEERLPVYRAGDLIVLSASVRRPGQLARLLGGYHFAVVGFSESGIKEIHDRQLRPSGTRGEPQISIRMSASDGKDERTRLIVLARRSTTFDDVSLRNEVARVMQAAPAGERINAATTHLARLAPGFLDTWIRTSAGGQPCAATE